MFDIWHMLVACAEFFGKGVEMGGSQSSSYWFLKWK